MNQLELSIVANARAELNSLMHFYQQRKAHDAEITEEVVEHLGNYYALNALLVFGHQANSGMSEEGMNALRMIEREHAELLRMHGGAPENACKHNGHTFLQETSPVLYKAMGLSKAEAQMIVQTGQTRIQ